MITRRAVSLPPWLWLFLGIALLALPQRHLLLLADLRQIAPGGVLFAQGFGALAPVLVGRVVVDAFGVLAIVAVAATVFLPPLRRLLVEGALPGTPAPAELDDVRRFVAIHGGDGVPVRSAAFDGYARVHPVSWRRAGIAVAPRLGELWRRDREAAQAILLREIARGRQGNHLLIGAGSPLTAALRAWPWVYLVFAVVPQTVLVLTTDPSPRLFAATVLTRGLESLVIPLLLPVSALWLVELEADRRAADVVGVDPVRRALALPETRQPRFTIVRPPLRLRSAVLGHAVPVVVPLLAWPAVWVLRQLVLTLGAAVDAGLYPSPSLDLPEYLLHLTGTGLGRVWPAWLAMALALAVALRPAAAPGAPART